MLKFSEDLDDETILEDKEVKRYLRVYIDLCSEQYFLYTEGYIKLKVWNEWKEGMQFSFQKKAIIKYWQEKESYYKEFKKFVDDELIQ